MHPLRLQGPWRLSDPSHYTWAVDDGKRPNMAVKKKAVLPARMLAGCVSSNERAAGQAGVQAA